MTTDKNAALVQAVQKNGKPVTLMNMWTSAWSWMRDNGIPINKTQERWIKEYPPLPYDKNSSIERYAYELTEHFENMKWAEMPENIKQVIIQYKIKTMKSWGWPSWGYKDVMQHKPKGANNDQ